MKQVFMLLTAALLVFNTSCKKNETTPTTTTVDSTTLYIHLHTNLDTNEVEDYNTVYEMESGRKVSAGIAQLYLSHIQLIKEDGSAYDIPNVIVFKVQETEPYLLGKVPVGNYKSVRFYVGLDSATNTFAATSNAALNHSEMWFNAAAQPGGYVYVNFQGKIDTTTDGDGTEAQMQPFMYMLGTGAAYKQVTMPDHTPVYNFTKDNTQYIHIIIDYAKLFTGVPLNNPLNLMIMNAGANASGIGTTVNNNIPSMFSYEE